MFTYRTLIECDASKARISQTVMSATVTAAIAAVLAVAASVHTVAHAHVNGFARRQGLQLAQFPDGFAELVLLRLRHAHCRRDCGHLQLWHQ